MMTINPATKSPANTGEAPRRANLPRATNHEDAMSHDVAILKCRAALTRMQRELRSLRDEVENCEALEIEVLKNFADQDLILCDLGSLFDYILEWEV